MKIQSGLEVVTEWSTMVLFSMYARWLAFQNEEDMHEFASAGEKATRAAALPIKIEAMALRRVRETMQ